MLCWTLQSFALARHAARLVVMDSNCFLGFIQLGFRLARCHDILNDSAAKVSSNLLLGLGAATF
jgi:hypothetical protein